MTNFIKTINKVVYKGLKIVIYSLKGSQGKTSLSAAIAKEEGFGIITNEPHSPLHRIFSPKLLIKLKRSQLLPTPEELDGADIIFDFGGFLDDRVIAGLEMSQVVVVPIVDVDILNIEGFVSTINEIQPYNNNIVIVLNMMTEDNKQALRAEIGKYKLPYPIFEINKSKALRAVIAEGKAVSEFIKEGGLRAFWYKTVQDQLTNLIKYLKSTGK